MASGDRFYELAFAHRPVYWGDIGSLLRVKGLVVGGSGVDAAVLLLPDSGLDVIWMGGHVHHLTAEQWSEYLRRSDDPEVLVMPEKAFHRKLRYEISGFVQQKIWAADGLKCVYCGVGIGKAPLTIDHFIPLEAGGVNDQSNYLTACKKCNKDKGSIDPKVWCEKRKLSYDEIVDYLNHRQVA